MENIVSWTEKQQTQQALWLTHNQHKIPKHIQIADISMSADAALKLAQENTAFIWRGDFQQAKQLLAAMKRRLQTNKKKAKQPDNITQRFHLHRMQQGQISRILSHLLIELDANWQINLPRSPDVKAALEAANMTQSTHNSLMPLQNLLGYIGAYQWYQKGVPINALNKKTIHVPFGVFSPLRGEYLELVQQAPLPNSCQTAFDIGTGSGILAAILAQRGIPKIIGTDTNPLAIQAAKDNINNLGFNQQVDIIQQDLFPENTADLIICNPPWLPAKPTSNIETALYDPDNQMLLALLSQAQHHLNENGEFWLILSNLAELLGLRESDDLNKMFNQFNWTIRDQLQTQATHLKSKDLADPLASARTKEITSLYILVKK